MKREVFILEVKMRGPKRAGSPIPLSNTLPQDGAYKINMSSLVHVT